jgi:hypothetical protein
MGNPVLAPTLFDPLHTTRYQTKQQRKQLPAEALATFPCKSHIVIKRVRKEIISEK